MSDLGNSLHFFLGEHQVPVSLLGQRGLGTHEVEKIQQRLDRVIDLVSKRGRKLALRRVRRGAPFSSAFYPKTC
jgi:hypothetical protein